MGEKKEYFRKVLDLCDELGNLKERLERRRGRAVTRSGAMLLAEKSGKLEELSAQLDRAFVKGSLGEIRKKYSLCREELLAIALLLSHRIRTGGSGLTGRQILFTIFDSGYDIVRGMGILSPEANLRATGMVVATDPYREDVLEATFRLSDDMFYAIVWEINGESGTFARPAGRPFASARDHTIEMGRLTALYRKRASLLFPLEAEDFFNVAGDLTLDEADYRIEAAWADIEGRLLLTPEYEKYPLVRLERRYALSREEIIIVVSLFFVELVSPTPYLIVGDLVKLVSRDEEELISHRSLLTSEATLLKSGVVVFDEEYSVHRKASTFEAYLADWVVEELAGPKHGAAGITADEQIYVHEFLKELGGKAHDREDKI